MLADTTAYAGERTTLTDLIERAFDVALRDALNKGLDIDVKRACLDALWILAIEAAQGFSSSLIFGKSAGYLDGSLHTNCGSTSGGI